MLLCIAHKGSSESAGAVNYADLGMAAVKQGCEFLFPTTNPPLDTRFAMVVYFFVQSRVCPRTPDTTVVQRTADGVALVTTYVLVPCMMVDRMRLWHVSAV